MVSHYKYNMIKILSQWGGRVQSQKILLQLVKSKTLLVYP